MKKILTFMIIAFTMCSGNNAFANEDYYVDYILDSITQKIELPSGMIIELNDDDNFSPTEHILRGDIFTEEELVEEELIEEIEAKELSVIDIMKLTEEHDALANEWDSALNLTEDIIELELSY